MLYAIVDSFARLVATQPDAVLGIDRVGARKPSAPSELPMIVVSLSIEDRRTAGIGRVMRTGEQVTRSSAVLEVSATPDTFSSDLRQLRLSPLPLRKNPASIERGFSADDVQVTNVSDAAHPVTYRFVRQPTSVLEYGIDAGQALISFGSSQILGEKLEVVHWTVTWRDDIEGAVYRGLMSVDVWAASLQEVTTAAKKLLDRPTFDPAVMRQLGFSRLEAASLASAEHVFHTPAVGPPFLAWRQPLTYRFAVEFEKPAQESSAGPIRHIDVKFDGDLKDSLGIPRPPS